MSEAAVSTEPPHADTPPAFRIGIFGPEDISAGPLTTHIQTLLAKVADRLAQARDGRPPLLRIISPAGTGAPAEVPALCRATLRTAQLSGVLQFRAEYVLGTRGTLLPPTAELDASELPSISVVLDGDGAPPNRSRRAVARMIMRNCDLMVIIAEHDQSLEGEVLRQVIRHGRMVLWLRPDGSPPVLLQNMADYGQRFTSAKRGADAWAAIISAMDQALEPPHHHAPHGHTLLERVVHWFQRVRSAEPPPPYKDFQMEVPFSGRGLWLAYGFARNLAAREGYLFLATILVWLTLWVGLALLDYAATSATLLVLHAVTAVVIFLGVLRPCWPHSPDVPSPVDYWELAYHAPDALSIAYANRYRSAYVIVILLIALALICAIFAIVFSKDASTKLLLGVLELLILVSIAGFVAATVAGRWQQKWVSYRLLAELCRTQGALARLGWSLSVLKVEHTTLRSLANTEWIAWHFNALLRAAPLPTLSMDELGKKAIRLKLVGEVWPDHKIAPNTSFAGVQIRYHIDRATKSDRAAATWGAWGEWLFVFTLFSVIAKLSMKILHFGDNSGTTAAAVAGALPILAATLPAISTAFFALRAYSEERLMAEQSRYMLLELARSKRAVDALNLSMPLSSEDLAAETFGVVETMMVDIAGWAQLVRVKVVEAG